MDQMTEASKKRMEEFVSASTKVALDTCEAHGYPTYDEKLCILAEEIAEASYQAGMQDPDAGAEKKFPIQDSNGCRGWIPWSVAEKAYQVYSFLFGTDQSIEKLAQRGGFSWLELGHLLGGDDYQRAYKRGFRFKARGK
ncbi:hypothetical protein [Bdellovibrio bacteriovorus]|uniref:hypothetical protein n=1 Tax=Bdellovibrio bacteriovorus TaxID=959 RepID=UPI0035A57475